MDMKYSKLSATKTAKPRQRTAQLLGNILVLWAIEKRDRTKAIWWDAKVVEVVLLNRRVVIILGTVCYSELAKYQESLYSVEFLKARGVLIFLRNLHGANDFSESESVWIFSDEVESELNPLLLQCNCFAEMANENDIRSLSIFGNFNVPARSGSVSQLNNNMISESSKFGLRSERVKFCLVNTFSNMCQGLRTYSAKSWELENLKSFLLTELLRNLDSKTQIPDVWQIVLRDILTIGMK